jgi:cytochrome c oxidase cbb3-type subunit 4
MSAGVVSGAVTGVLLVLFLFGWAWAWSERRRSNFEAAARLPLADEGQEHRA